MAEPTDIESLARRFLDLWQEQLAAMAANPEFVDSAERILNGLKPGQTESAAGDPPGATDDSTRTSTARVSLDARDDGMRRLESRLAALEQRLAALESGSAGESGGAGGSGDDG
jgi:hypothetical protein